MAGKVCLALEAIYDILIMDADGQRLELESFKDLDIARRRLDRRRRRGERGLVHQLGLARPPPVQRGLGRSGAFGDRGHRQVRIADFHKQIRGGAQYGSVDTRIPGPPGARGLVNR